VFCSFQRDAGRVMDFVERFYDGDSNGTFQKALRYYYQEKFSESKDRTTVGNLVTLVATDLSQVPTKRKGLSPSNPVTSTTTTAAPLEAVAKLMGKNFLGPAQWKTAFKVDVGVVPPLPASLTKALLESPCPIEPGKQIKDTHILVLVPAMVNGQPYTPLKLDAMCEGKKGSGDAVIDPRWEDWKKLSFAKESLPESRWALIPKRDPDPKLVSEEQHFRSKSISSQKEVHAKFYPEYREAKTLELMTQVVLNDLVHGERLLPDCYLRCEELNAVGGRVCLGYFHAVGLSVIDDFDADVISFVGWSVARSLGS